MHPSTPGEVIDNLYTLGHTEGMQQHTWASQGYTTSNLVYGCMEIGGSWDDSPIDDAARRTGYAALDAARDAGYTAYDHADIYCYGKSERLFGEWLREHPGLREEIVIQSKCGIRIPNTEPQYPKRSGEPYGRASDTVVYDFSYHHIVRSVEASLSRLGVDYLDILLLHRPDPLMQPEEVARGFDDLHRAGKVRTFGVSNHSAAQIDLLRTVVDHPIAVNQMEIGLAHPDLLVAGTAGNQREPGYPLRDRSVVEDSMTQGVQLQGWSSLSRGKYSGRPNDEDDPRVSATSAIVANLAKKYETTREAIVLAWILRHPARILPIVGSTNPKRIIAASKATGVCLEREEWYELVAAVRGFPMP